MCGLKRTWLRDVRTRIAVTSCTGVWVETGTFRASNAKPYCVTFYTNVRVETIFGALAMELAGHILFMDVWVETME